MRSQDSSTSERKNTLRMFTDDKKPVAEEGVDLSIAKSNCLSTIGKMVGMDEVKKSIDMLLDRTYIQSMRNKYGLKSIKSELNIVFTGNPGTGKTSVARILGKTFKDLGLITSGHTVEVTRKDLVSNHIGDTALKTSAIIDKAVGGVLFIDEAYALDPTAKTNDFGAEAIETLMVAMEDKRDNLIVIAAGYPDKMKGFLDSNPGLRSRFSRTINFRDFNGEELYSIAESSFLDHDYTLTEDAIAELKSIMSEAKETAESKNSNGRGVRQKVDKIVEMQAHRLAKEQILGIAELKLITVDDVREARIFFEF